MKFSSIPIIQHRNKYKSYKHQVSGKAQVNFMCGKQKNKGSTRIHIRIICLFFPLIHSLMVSYKFVIMIGIDEENISPRRKCALTWDFHRQSKLMKNYLKILLPHSSKNT